MAIKKELNILICLLTLIVSLSIVSSASIPSVWERYGTITSSITHAQLSNSYSNFDTSSPTSFTFADGYSSPHTAYPQALVTDFFDTQGSVRFIVEQSGNFLNFYDSTLSLVAQKATTTNANQIAIGTFSGSIKRNEIAGLYNGTVSNQLELRFYSFNTSNYALSLKKQINISLTGIGNSYGDNGLSCISGGDSYCTFVKVGGTYYHFFKVYYNGSIITKNFSLINGFNPVIVEPTAIGDFNNDGEPEYLVYDDLYFYVLDGYGNIILQKSIVFPDSSNPMVRAFFPDASNVAKFVVSYNTNNGVTSYLRAITYRIDGSTLWTSQTALVISPFSVGNGGIAIAQAVGGTGRDDVFLGASTLGNSNNQFNYFITLKGTDGTTLYQFATNFLTDMWSGVGQKFTIAKMTPSNQYDYISSFSPVDNVYYIFNQSGTVIGNGNIPAGSSDQVCVTGDMNFDTLNDLICTGAGITNLIVSNYTNQAPTLNNVTFSPSISVQTNQPVNAIISCTDPESDQLIFEKKCNTGDAFSTGLASAVQSCTYSGAGIYSMTVGCSDIVHPLNYSTLTQLITVTQGVISCNNNAICESGLGENANTCPSDCGTQTISGSAGAISIPSQLVDTSTPNSNNGILPEVYFGLLNFLSNSLSPIFIVVFIIFTVLIILTLGLIIKKIFIKVSDLGH